MRKVFTAAAFALFGLMVSRADAMPFPALNDGLSGVAPVAFGCGPGWTRGPYGGCHPMGGYGFVGPRVYGYGYHPMPVPTAGAATAIIHTRAATAIIATIVISRARPFCCAGISKGLLPTPMSDAMRWAAP